jgi:O-antigen ligase
MGRMLSVGLALLVDFAALARGAHDLWAATIVYIAFLCLAAAVVLKAAWSKDSPGVPIDFILPLGGVAAAMAFSFSRSFNPSESFLGLMDWLTALAAFWIALSAFRSEEGVELFLAGTIPVFIVEAAVHAYQRATIAVPVIDASGARHNAPQALTFLVTQSWGTLVNANLAAAFAIAWVPVLSDLALKRRGRPGFPPPAYWATGAAAAALTFAFAFSAWGWICLVLGLPLLIDEDRLRKRLRTRRRSIIASAAAALTAGAVLVSWKLFHKHDWAGNAVHRGENISRVLWWASGLKMFRAFPLSGVGIGGYGSAYLAFKVGRGQNSLFVHSFPIQMAAETGVLGCAALLVFFGAWIRSVVIDWKRARERRPFLAGIAMLLAFSTISLSMEYLSNILVSALFMGAVAAPLVSRYWKPRRSAAVVAGAAALAACSYVAAPFLASRNTVGAQQLLEAGRPDEAIAGFASAASMDPLSSAAQAGWGRALHARFLAARDPRDGEQAAAHLKRALELDRLNGELAAELVGCARELEAAPTSSRNR